MPRSFSLLTLEETKGPLRWQQLFIVGKCLIIEMKQSREAKPTALRLALLGLISLWGTDPPAIPFSLNMLEV